VVERAAVAGPWSNLALAEQLNTVLRQGPPFMAGTLILSLSSAAIVWESAPRVALIVMLIVVNMLFFMWRSFYLQYKRSKPSAADARKWVNGAAVRAGVQGGCWGIYSLVIFVPGSAAFQIIDLTIMFGLATGALAVCGSLYRGMLMFAVPTLLPVTLRCFAEGTLASVAMGAAGLAGLGFIAHAGRTFSKVIIASIENRLENVALAQELEKQKQTAENALALAEGANRSKSRFLAAASHDLRQPVHALGLFVAAAKHPTTAREHALIIDRMGSAVASLAALFDSLLDISRLDSGLLQPEIKTVFLLPILQKLAAEYAPEVRGKKLTFRLRCSNLAIRTDPLLFERLIRNLLSNAVRYTNSGGILVACRKRGVFVRVEVWDTGIGIAPEKQTQVFEEFYQIGNPERDRRNGVGLGLAIVKRIAAMLEHPLHLTSGVGRGTRFSIEIPISGVSDKNAESSTQPDYHDETTLFGVVIVVIDDEADILAAVGLLLKQWGCAVITADSGAQALEKLQAEDLAPDLIVSDFRLRNSETGIDAIRTLRSQFGDGVPSLLLTGDTAAEQLRKAAASGLEVLHKPLNAQQLKRVLIKKLACESD
jgi:signal transduction histidine kinase/CheY-like chemotaxis protein